MQRGFISFQFVNQLLRPVDQLLIGDTFLDAPVALNRLADLLTLVAHGVRASMRRPNCRLQCEDAFTAFLFTALVGQAQ